MIHNTKNWRNNFIKFDRKFLSLKLIIYNLILIPGFIFTISINSIFADSDFVLKLINVNTVPTISNLELDGENVQEICPLDKCKLQFINSSFNPPKPNSMIINHTIKFILKGNIANVDSVPLKKRIFGEI